MDLKNGSNDLLIIIIKCTYLLFFNHFATIVHFIIKILICHPYLLNYLDYLLYPLYFFILLTLHVLYETLYNIANKNNAIIRPSKIKCRGRRIIEYIFFEDLTFRHKLNFT